VAGSTGLEGFVRAGEVEAYKKELEAMRSQTADQVRAAQSQSMEQVNKFRSEYAGKLHFDYQLDPKLPENRFSLTPFTTMTHSPTSSALPVRSLRFMK